MKQFTPLAGESWEEWCSHNARQVYMAGTAMLQEKQKDILCWHLYNGITNERDWDYLRKVNDFEYPAKVRHIPILSSRFKRLKAHEIRRFFKPTVFTVNADAIKDKLDLKAKAIVDMIVSAYTARIDQIDEIRQQLAEQQAQIQQGQSRQDGQQPDESTQYMIQKNQRLIAQLEKPLKREEIFTQKKLDEIEKYYSFEYKDLWELYANSGLKAYIDKYNLRDLFVEGIEEKIVTDQPIYCVEWKQGDSDPIFRKVNSIHFYHSKKGQSSKLEDCDWYREDRWMSAAEIMAEFRHDGLPEKLIEQLKNPNYFGYGTSIYNTPFYNPSGYTDGSSANTMYSGMMDNSKRFMVSRCVWRANRRIGFSKSPNKYSQNSFFLHWVPEDRLDPESDIMLRYKTEWYETTLINGMNPVRMQRLSRPKSVDNYSASPGPYIGKNYDGLTSRPYSLVWATKDIQILYNLINYHMELWLALSGVKGIVMDASQKPEGMTDAEWRYQRKLGTAWIQTVRNGIQRNATFNQFQTYDDTIGSSIQYLQRFLEYLENVASTIIGVFHPQLGQVEPTDQVGTYNQSNQMSSMVTEILYYEHDQIKLRALTQLVNLFKDSWENGKALEYAGDGLAQSIVNIPKSGLSGADFVVRVDNGLHEEERVKELKQQILASYQKGEIRLNQWIKLYSKDTVKEMEAMVEKYADEALAMQQNAMQNQMAAEQQAKEFEERLKQSTVQIQGKISMQLEQMKGELEQLKLQVGKSVEDAKISTQFDIAKMEDKTKRLDIQSERDVELAYLEQQRQEAQAEAQLKLLEIASGEKMKEKKIQESRKKENIK